MVGPGGGSRRGYATLAAVVVLAAGLAGAAKALDVGRGLELETVDLRFDVRGTQPPPEDVVLVQVDERSLSELGLRWPFPRSLHARLIDRLTRAGARTIAIDLQFTEQTEIAEDNALIEAIDRADRVVLGTTAVSDQGATNVLGGDDVVSDIGARVGSALLPPDPGGTLRRLPYSIGGLESFAVVTAELTTRRQVDPFDEDTTWIDYAGPPGTLRSFPYSSVLRGRVSDASFRDKVVVVGTEAPRLKDVSPTSTTDGTLMSGPEIQGNAIDTVLRGLPLTSTAGLADAALIVILALCAPLAALRFTPAIAALAAVLVGLVYLVAAQLLFGGGLIVPVVHPLAALGFGVVGVLALARERGTAPTPMSLPVSEGRGTTPAPLPVSEGRDSTPAPIAASRQHDQPAPRATVRDEPEPIGVGDEIAGFRLEEIVGRGGMGVVFRAEQIGLGRKAAVKVIASSYAANTAFRERFSREARAAAAIDHPNIVPVYGAGEERACLYLAMRLVDGIDLAERLRRTGRLGPLLTAEVIGQIASALDAAHERGLVHRDVKPANVLLVERAGAPLHAYLTDFGITREVEATRGLTATGAFVGSVDYAAPEQIRAEGTSGAGDVYSLGCVAFECLTGEPPFLRDKEVATLWAHINDPPPRASERVTGLSADVDGVLARALAKTPDERWSTCADFAAALRAVLRGDASERPTYSEPFEP